MQGLKERELTTPVVVRFSDILAHRLKHLHDAFAQAIAENDYQNRYAAVFPIKVNQQRLVVEEVYRYGKPFGFGLEVGSKPELLSVMGMTADAPDRLIVCNGFKDDSYLEAAIIATKLGRTIIPVVENFSELPAILRIAEKYNVRPRIGVRVKLASEGSGKWRDSAGDKSKFGLFITEILEAVEILREKGMLDCLQLVHCHPGSQLQDIRRVKDAINELAHVYAELKLLGAGLQVHRRGRRPRRRLRRQRHQFLLVDELHAERIRQRRRVSHRQRVQHAQDRPPDDRQRVGTRHRRASQRAHLQHARHARRSTSSRSPARKTRSTARELPQPVRDLLDAYRTVTERRVVECYHDAQTARDQVLQMFNLGLLSLEQRGLAERLYWATCAKVRDLTRKLDEVPEELEELESILSDIYFCNFSVFQSLPDSWAIDQLFPIMPIHRLNERPTRKAVLADITCDSDGKIDRFVSQRDVKRTLELHAITAQDEYYLAAFLVGAYQETLGDLHNLFGDTHVVHIRFHDDGGWWIEEIVKGDTANKVLEYMEYDVADLHPALARDCERAVREGRMSVAESQGIKRFYEGELNGYAYLE